MSESKLKWNRETIPDETWFLCDEVGRIVAYIKRMGENSQRFVVKTEGKYSNDLDLLGNYWTVEAAMKAAEEHFDA